MRNRILMALGWFIAIILVIGLAQVASASTMSVTHPLFSGKERYSHTSDPVEYYKIYTENGGVSSDTLRLTLSNNVYSPVFSMAQENAPKWIYPNVGQGDEWGMRPDHSWMPVRADHDGNPVASFNDTLKWTGTWAAAFDLWFNTTPDAWVNQNNATEIMIWNAAASNGAVRHRGPGNKLITTTKVDGVVWNVNYGIACNSITCWNRIYFVAQTPYNRGTLALNPFIAWSRHYGAVKAGDYLTGADYGFELHSNGLTGMALNAYSLTGITDTPAVNEVLPGVHHKPVWKIPKPIVFCSRWGCKRPPYVIFCSRWGCQHPIVPAKL